MRRFGQLAILCLALFSASAYAATDEEIASDFIMCAVIADQMLQIAQQPQQKMFFSQQSVLYSASATALTSPAYVDEQKTDSQLKFRAAMNSGNGNILQGMIASTLEKCGTHMKADGARIAEKRKAKGLAADSPLINIGKFVLPVPKQGWQLTFDAPPLNKMRENDAPDQYSYAGGYGRFNMSFFVEPPRCPNGSTHEDVYKCFQGMRDLSKEPFKRQDETAQNFPAFYRASYRIVQDVEGNRFEQLHINYYFIFQSKWMDLHVSMVKPTPEDMAFLAAFEKSLRYEKTN
jgi:hypothetical protein